MNKKENTLPKRNYILLGIVLFILAVIPIFLDFIGVFQIGIFNHEPDITIIDTKIDCHNEEERCEKVFIEKGNYSLPNGYYGDYKNLSFIDFCNNVVNGTYFEEKEVCSQEEVDEIYYEHEVKMYDICPTDGTMCGYGTIYNISKKDLTIAWLDENCKGKFICENGAEMYINKNSSEFIFTMTGTKCRFSNYYCFDKYIVEINK